MKLSEFSHNLTVIASVLLHILINGLYILKNKCNTKFNDVLCDYRLVEYDPATHRALLGAHYLKKRLPVDTSQIEPFSGKIGSLYQVIGDIQDFTDKTKPRLLKASLVRCVDGLDVFEYSRAIDRQRRHFKLREEFMQIGSISNDPAPIEPEKENPLDPDGLEKMPRHLRNISSVNDFVRLCLEDEHYSDLEDSGDRCDP